MCLLVNREEGRGWGFGGGNWGRWSRPQECPESTPSGLDVPSCRSRLLRCSPDELVLLVWLVCVKSHSGWRLHHQCDPSGRHGLLCVSIVRSNTRYCIRLTTPRSQNWWKRAHLTHGSSRNARGTLGRSLQPCPLLTYSTDKSEFALQVSWFLDPSSQDAFFTRTSIFFFSSAPSGTSPAFKYFQRATNSFRAKATIPTFRHRLFPLANRRSYHRLSSLWGW
jgi:hypothetical protein